MYYLWVVVTGAYAARVFMDPHLGTTIYLAAFTAALGLRIAAAANVRIDAAANRFKHGHG
jgi:hypothetical protein